MPTHSPAHSCPGIFLCYGYGPVAGQRIGKFIIFVVITLKLKFYRNEHSFDFLVRPCRRCHRPVPCLGVLPCMKREDEGTPRMREIAEHVRRGAMAYLRQQYKVVAIVFMMLALFFRLSGLRRRGAEPVGALRLPDGRFLFGACRLFRHEDRDLRLGTSRPTPRASRSTAA